MNADDDTAGEPARGTANPGKTCPSSSCHEGALLLGIMTTSGRLAYVSPPVMVDAAFAAEAHSQGSPERRYRFADRCVEHACPQWNGNGCAIADLAADGASRTSGDNTPLPSCSIRHSCRWFAQRGRDACTACPLLVADMGGTDTYRSHL